MTLFHDVSHARLLARYRVLFRASTMAFGAAVVLIGVGILTIMFANDGSVLGGGLLLAAASGLLAYKVAVSTMKLIDAEAAEDDWRVLGA